MADDHAAVAQEMSVGARIGGTSTVVTLVSVAHAFSHAYGALMQTALADVADKTSMEMLFGLDFTVGSAIGAPWAFLIGALVDGYGFAAAFAAMAASQVLAALVLIPVRIRQTVPVVPSHP